MLLQYEDVRAPLEQMIESKPVTDLIGSLVTTARELQSIDLPLLARSMVRAEEFARRLAKALDIPFDGEDPRRSAERLARIDYQRLLAKVDAAKLTAEERMEALLKQQAQDDERIQRVRRGKW
jgi:broad specificity phosphatase PhoE